jgi:hypothetical protein
LKLREDEFFVVQFNPLIVELKWEKKVVTLLGFASIEKQVGTA